MLRAWKALPAGLIGVSAMLAASGCHDAGSAPRQVASLRVVAGGGEADTVMAMTSAPLTVEVRDSTGRLMQGADVDFRALPLAAPPGGNGRRGVYVCPASVEPCAVVAPDGSYFTVYTTARAATDAAGRAQANVQLGVVAGADSVDVSVASLGLDVVVPYTTDAGSAARVVAAVADTTVYVGASYALGASTADVYGNPRQEPVHVASLTPGVATEGGGVVSALSVGRGKFLMTSEAVADSSYAFVSVPPPGRLITFGWAPDKSGLSQLTLVNSDGTGRRLVLTTAGANGIARPLWTPGGELLFEEGLQGADPTLQLIDTMGTRHGTLDSTFSMSMEAAYSSSPAELYFYGAPKSGGPVGIYKAQADGSAPAFLVPGYAPAPSPDGSRIAFVHGDTVYVRNNGDGTKQAIATNAVSVRWSPDGDWIAFIPVEEDAVTFIHPDGTGRHSTQWRFVEPYTLSWSPDGLGVMVAGAAGGLLLVRASDGEAIPIAGTGDLLEPGWRP